MEKILITGGSGVLGSEIKKNIKCIAPDFDELDVTNKSQCINVVNKYNPDIIIHCAAWTDVAGAENNKKKCWAVNVTGAENMVKAANGRRFVYISTDYVFDGEKGNYSENDATNPQNYYAQTKLEGELVVKKYPNTLIIRTAFKKDGPWKYEKAFVDQFTSHIFASEVTPQIIKAALMTDLVGTIHIAGERKSMYDLAMRASPNVGKMSIKDVSVKIPKDTSLNISKWKKILAHSS